MSPPIDYLVNTTTLIDYGKGIEPVRTRFLHLLWGGSRMGVCAVQVAEVYSGVGPGDRPQWDRFFSALPYWTIEFDAARQAGRWRYAYARRGIQLSTTDVLIAAVAWQMGATVITSNLRHFPMPEIAVVSLR